eukprot:2451485-Pyramimonas_sp.AAC.1
MPGLCAQRVSECSSRARICRDWRVELCKSINCLAPAAVQAGSCMAIASWQSPWSPFRQLSRAMLATYLQYSDC